MVASWRWRRRQPAHLWLYGGLSLVIHGAALLALQWVDPPADVTPVAELPPIEIVEVPKVTVDDTPPPDTENRAAQNTVAQGIARPDKPLGVETTRRSQESTASQPAPTTASQQETVPQPTPDPSPVARPEPPPVTPEPQPAPSPVVAPDTPSPVATRPEPQPLPSPAIRPEPQPESVPIAKPAPVEPASEPIARPATQPRPTPNVAQSQPVPRPVTPAPPAPSQPVARAAPPVPSRPATVPKGDAALLGGPISRNVQQALLDQEANSTRNAPGPTQLAARQDVDLGPYLSNLRRRVQQNWRPRAPDQQRQTVVGFTVNRNGQIANLRVLRSSGSPQTDAETLEAIQRAAPFGPLPEQFAYNQLEIEFTFNIYVNNVVIQQPRSWYGF
ncbi:MAG: TonB family protein [Gloeomargarita sp. SKYG116]|nr:TonB family protein [Gloeomargarita sp. SKYG116]MCS7226231.1 TonB family protein [Gloeomargarita sp. SKYB31]MDW8401824.1 TonB family protein [Gloeomargarita sp. SKYGB_i_bin116]